MEQTQKPPEGGVVDFDALCAALKHKGLEPKDIIEAELLHIATLMVSSQVQNCSARKRKVMPLLFKLAAGQGEEALHLLEGEVILMAMPAQLLGVIGAMCSHGVMDKERAAKNWKLVEEYLDTVIGTVTEAEKALRELVDLAIIKPD